MTQAKTSPAELALFLILTFAASVLLYALVSSGMGHAYLLMWVPGVSAIATRLLFHRNARGLGWSLPSWRLAALAWIAPVLYASVAYGLVWWSGMGGMDPSRFHADVPTFLIVGLLQSMLLSLGEEIGWRGFLVPALASSLSFRGTAIASGLIWALWHVPLILFADYNAGTPAWYALPWFFVMVVAISFPLAWIRLRSGSVWPATILHASHNLFLQGWFDQVTVDAGPTRWLVGEFGAILALTVATCAWLFLRAATTPIHVNSR
jgi:membrane protease YdiL (CAAX protease family)